jgi:hypothetical protein
LSANLQQPVGERARPVVEGQRHAFDPRTIDVIRAGPPDVAGQSADHQHRSGRQHAEHRPAAISAWFHALRAANHAEVAMAARREG